MMDQPRADTKPASSEFSSSAASPASSDSGFGALVPEAERITRARRLYLTRRRRELLAPAHALHEIIEELADAEPIQDFAPIFKDLGLVRDSVVRLIRLIDETLDPTRAHDHDATRPLNHDVRNHLAIIIGYAEDIRRNAAEAFLDAFFAEFDQLQSLGWRILALVDSTAAQLRAPHVTSGTDAGVDDLHAYLERGDLASSTIDDDLPPADSGVILVAEDHDQIRERLCEMLRRQGHQVIAARDGHEALNLIGLRPFDLVITDIDMPGASGFEILDHVRRHESLREIAVIVVSGHGELENICRCIKSGAEDYLPKPYNQVILKARVDACLEKRRLRHRHELQRRQYDELIHAILPRPIVAEMAETKTVRPRRRDGVAVLFADIVGFTPFCNRYQDQPEIIVRHLQKAFESWEEIAAELGVLKIKSIGDAFLATSGLLDEPANPVFDCVRCGLRMIEATRGLTDDGGLSIGWDLRVGIHVGPVVAGVLGKRQSILDLWGDTVNIAARVESHGLAGHVNLTAPAWDRVRGRIEGETHSFRRLKGTESEREVVSLDPANIRVVDPLASGR